MWDAFKLSPIHRDIAEFSVDEDTFDYDFLESKKLVGKDRMVQDAVSKILAGKSVLESLQGMNLSESESWKGMSLGKFQDYRGKIGSEYNDYDEVIVVDKNGKECTSWIGEKDPKYSAKVLGVKPIDNDTALEVQIDYVKESVSVVDPTLFSVDDVRDYISMGLRKKNNEDIYAGLQGLKVGRKVSLYKKTFRGNIYKLDVESIAKNKYKVTSVYKGSRPTENIMGILDAVDEIRTFTAFCGGSPVLTVA